MNNENQTPKIELRQTNPESQSQ